MHYHLHLLPLLGLIAAARFGPVAADAESPSDEPPQHLDQGSLIAMQFTEDPHADRDPMEMIRNGELHLAAISYEPTSFADDGDEYYGANVMGDFCAFNPSVNRHDPAHYPTIGDVMSESNHCGEHRRSLPLRAVVEHVLAADAAGTGATRSLPVSALLFHEAHSGAGLVSNVLATFGSARVVSEHPALRDALAACDVIANRYLSGDCLAEKRLRLVADVVGLLARTSAGDSDDVKHFFLKVSSASAAYLPELRSLFPDSKWVFVYRDPAEALAKATERRRYVMCIKARRNPSSALSAKATELGVDLEGLSHHEVCALHLSTLLDAAARDHEETGTGLLISYDDHIVSNVDFITNTILPYLGLQEEVDSDRQAVEDRVSGVLSFRSNTRVKLNPEEKKWDSESVELSDEVVAASNTFMRESMDSITQSHGRK